MSDIEIGDTWRTKRNPVDYEVIEIDFSGDFTRITSYSKSDDVTDACTYDEFLRDYEFVRKADETDMVNHPPHYKDASGIECIEVTKHMQFCGGNCFKYLYRAGKKGSTVEDLKKAIWYAERAWLGSEQVCDDAVKKIEHIARYRTGFIQDAMQDMVDEDWLALIASVDSELDMLESEAVDD